MFPFAAVLASPAFGTLVSGISSAIGAYSAKKSEEKALKKASKHAEAVGQYNVKLNNFRLNRELTSLQREIRSFRGEQLQAASSTGVALSSQSNLDVLRENMAAVEQRILQMRNSTAVENEAALFEARSKVSELKSSAKSAGQEATSGLFSKLPTLLSQGSNFLSYIGTL